LKKKEEKEKKDLTPAQLELIRLQQLVNFNAAAKTLEPSKAPVLKNSARLLFEENKAKTKIELRADLKEFMIAGTLVRHFTNDIGPRPRRLYLSPDLEYLIWKNPKKAEIKKSQRMRIFKLHTVEEGLCTPQLKKRFIQNPAKEELAFAMFGSDSASGEDKSFSFEAHNVKDRDKWLECLRHLIDYARDLKLYGTQTVHMTDNVLVPQRSYLVKDPNAMYPIE